MQKMVEFVLILIFYFIFRFRVTTIPEEEHHAEVERRASCVDPDAINAVKEKHVTIDMPGSKGTSVA